MPDYKVPEFVESRDELPMTNVGNVKRCPKISKRKKKPRMMTSRARRHHSTIVSC